jgi:hypothetical protein
MIDFTGSTAMKIDQDTSPSIKSESDRDDTTQASSVHKFSHPPTIISTKQVPTDPFAQYLPQNDEETTALQKAVATTLFHMSPETVQSFLSPTVANFKAIFKRDKQLIIWRKGNLIFVRLCTAYIYILNTPPQHILTLTKIGIFEHHTLMKVYGFEHLAGLAIGYDGSWHVIKSAGNAFCEPKLADAWAGKYRCLGGVDEMVVEYEDMVVEKARRVSMLAESMLEGRFWEGKVVVKTT